MRHNLLWLWGLLSILWLVYCDRWPTEEERFKSEIVVYGFLVAGQSVDSLVVQRTVDITKHYSPEAALLTGETVVLRCTAWVDSLQEYPTCPGFYYGHSMLHIETGETYALQITAPSFPQMLVSTKVPEPVTLLNKPSAVDTILYHHGNDIDTVYPVEWTKVPDAKGYYCVIESHTTLWIRDSIDKLFNNTDDPPGREASTALSDSTWYDIPHLFFDFAGLNTLKVYAVSAPFYDYLRTRGEEVPLSNIEGGYGYFASASVDSIQVYVKATQDTVNASTLEDGQRKIRGINP